jgi:hypothetical protein
MLNNTEKLKNTIYDFSDTSKMRGMWYKMLIDAAKADNSTKEEILYVCGQLRTLCDFFPCLNCKLHFKERLSIYPPELVIDETDGLFIWTYEFLNSVNSRINKPLYDYKIIYPIFHTTQFTPCNSLSGETIQENSNKILPNTIYDFSDTSKMRGMWCKMLIDAAKADKSTKEEILYVCGQLRTLCEFFPCLNCKLHFKEYLSNHPPELVINDKDGLFIWTYEFLNSVNSKLNKPLYDYKIIYPIFHNIGYMLCDSSCGETIHENGEKVLSHTNNLSNANNLSPSDEKGKSSFILRSAKGIKYV